jgi:hypothetical protein
MLCLTYLQYCPGPPVLPVGRTRYADLYRRRRRRMSKLLVWPVKDSDGFKKVPQRMVPGAVISSLSATLQCCAFSPVLIYVLPFPKSTLKSIVSLSIYCLKQSTLQGRASGYTSCYYPTNGAQKEQWISQKQCTPYAPPRPAKTGIQRQPAKKDPKPSIHVWREVKPCSATGWSDTRIAESLLSAATPIQARAASVSALVAALAPPVKEGAGAV